MTISLVGSTITIDSGFAAGTATGGTSTTLTGSGFGTLTNRIVWITGGTGAGQSRFIRTNTSTTLNVEPNWDTVPDATSTFSIGYTWADIDAAMASVTVSSVNFYLVPNNLTLSAGGFIGSINEHVRFTVSVPVVTTDAGSLWQQGRLLNTGTAAQGGSIELAYALTGSTFNDYTLAGLVRWYRANVAALPGNGNYRFNDGVISEGLDFRDCYFNNVYVVSRGNDRFDRCALNSKPFWVKSADAPAFGEVSFIENSFIISGDNGAGANSHYFGLTFEGIPRDATFSRPYWVWNTTNKEGTYFWNTAAPAFANTFAASTWFGAVPSTAGFYTGKTVNVQTRQPDGSGLASVLIGLWDNAGNAAWFEGVNTSTGVPINSLTITTDGSGNYANPHPAVAGQSGLVIAERLKKTGATLYGPWTVRARKYGYLEAGGARSYANNSTEILIISVDPAITEANGATVAAYTTLETSAKFYDRYQYFLSLAANIKTDNGLSRSGTLIDAGSYNVTIDATAAQAFSLSGNTITIKASTYTGDMTTTGIITLANGAEFIGTRTDANGTVAPPKTVSITGIVAGSRLQIYNVTTATEVVNQVVSGTSYTATYDEGTGYTTGDTVRVRLAYDSGVTAKLPFSGQAVVGSTGWSLLASQQDDAVYNTLAIDGSAVTEFAPDYPNVQVDISDPDGSTRVDRLYAWFVHTQSSEDGIRNWFAGIVPEDEANFRVVTATLDLKIDNVSTTGVTFTDGRRLYRDDNASPLVNSTSGGGSITLFSGKVYTSVVSTASPVITGDIEDIPAAVQTGLTTQGYTTTRAAEISAIKTTTDSLPSAIEVATQVRTELTTELGRIDEPISTRLASADYTAPDNAGITANGAAIAALNDISTTDLAQALLDYDGPTKAELDTAFNEIKGAGWTDETLKDIRDNTGAIDNAAVASAVRTELTTELARIDEPISTRLASVDYIAPDNAGITSNGSAIAALNDVSTTDLAQALLDYDGPTKAELDSAFNEIKGAGWTDETLKDIRDNTGVIDNAAVASAVRTELTTELARIDEPISTRLASVDYVAPDNAGITSNGSAIAALNDVSTTDLAQALLDYDGPTKAELDSAFDEIKGAGWTDETLKDIRDNTGVIDNAAVASAVRTELTTELARIDEPISTRLASADFTLLTEDQIRAAIGLQNADLDAKFVTVNNNIDTVNDNIIIINSNMLNDTYSDTQLQYLIDNIQIVSPEQRVVFGPTSPAVIEQKIVPVSRNIAVPKLPINSIP